MAKSEYIVRKIYHNLKKIIFFCVEFFSYQNRGYSPDPRSPPGRYNYTARYSLLSPLLGNSHEYSRQSHYSPSPHTSPHYRTRSENISPLYDPRIENIFPLYRPRSEKRYNRSHLSYNEVLPNGSRRDFERYIQKCKFSNSFKGLYFTGFPMPMEINFKLRLSLIYTVFFVNK